MGKYTTRVTRERPKKEWERGPHVIWRGIGCLMILLVPFLSTALGVVTIDYGIAQEWRIPYQFLGKPDMPDAVYKVGLLRQLTYPIRQINNFYGYAAASVVYLILIGGLISVLYAFVYQFIGPSRYGPFDAPPPKIRTKRYTR